MQTNTMTHRNHLNGTKICINESFPKDVIEEREKKLIQEKKLSKKSMTNQ